MTQTSFWFIGITLCVIALTFMSNEVISNISEEEGLGTNNMFFNYDDSHIKQFDSSGNYTLTDDYAQFFPKTQQNTNVAEDSGNWFTDTFSTFKDWLLDLTGIKFILNLINALPNFLKLIFRGDFQIFAFMLGYVWWFLFIISVIKFARGQD